MRIFLLNTRTGWAGGEQWFLWAASALSARGHAVRLLTGRQSALAERADAEGIAVAPVTPHLLRHRLLRSLVRGEKPDIILCNTGGETRAALRCRGKRELPRVVLRRGLCKPVSNHRLYRRLDTVLCNSERTLKVMRQSLTDLPGEHFGVIYNPAPPQEPVNETELARWRAHLGLSEEHQVFLSVGRLAPEKGHRFLLDAFAELTEEHEQARLLIAGEGPEQPNLEAQVAELHIAERVRLCGFVRDTDVLYELADVLVQPSLPGYESFSNAALEGMSHGLPVVATTVGGFCELIEQDRHGLLVPPADSRALLEVMQRLVEEPEARQHMGRAARARVANEFSPEKKATELEDVLSRILQTGRP